MICFIHIEKTAGTTIDHIFINNFSFYYSLKSYCYWTNQKGSFFKEKEFRSLIKLFPFINGIGGHSIRNWLEYEKSSTNLNYITFLREPISRYLSHYRYQKHIMNIPWNIHTFLNENRFDNYMTFRLSEKGDLNEAKVNLMKFDFVGLQEEFDTSLILMQYYLKDLNLSINYESKNVSNTKNDNVVSFLDNDYIKKKIIEKNLKDIQLYNFAKEQIL